MERKDNAYQNDQDKSQSRENNAEKKILELILSILVAFVVSAIVRFLGPYAIGLIAFLIIFAGAGFIGNLWAKSYIKREKINTKLISVVARSNFLTWIIPILGVFTGFATLKFTEHPQLEGKEKYRTLAIVGIILSIVNLVIGIWIRLTK